MYKCHLCDLQTKQLNGLMSRHYKTHCSTEYTKEQYKTDVLAQNGRPLNNCEACGEIVPIPKGEAQPPRLHKKCYVKNISGQNNPNYRGGLVTVKCACCKVSLQKHKSHLKRENKFCSVKCSMNWYTEPENRTEKQKINDDNGGELLKKLRLLPENKIAHAKALAKMQLEKTSKLETEVLNKIRQTYPLAHNQVVKDFYTVDIYIPEIDTYLDVHGNYWHNQQKHLASNNRKSNFFNNKGLKYLELWGNEIDYSTDPVAWASKKPSIYVLCGPSGSGKTWASKHVNNFSIIDVDVLGFDKALDAALEAKDKSLVVINTQATRFVKTMAQNGVRCFTAIISEEEDTISHRLSLRGGTLTDGVKRRIKRYATLSVRLPQFSGTQSEVIDWLRLQ